MAMHGPGNTESFTFGIPLIGRQAARSWARVEALLELTLASLRAQTDGDFRVIVAGHDRPRPLSGDPRFSFLAADWPAEAPDGANRDGGRKKDAIKSRVLARGGGLLMFVDADDWLDRRLVETARAGIGAADVGGWIPSGCAVDIRHLRAAPIPHPALFEGGFHRICGSSTVARLRPDAADPLRRDPFAVLHEHYRFVEMAARHGLPVVALPARGGYVVNTAENHSELHGPFAEWRRSFNEGVGRLGAPLDAREAGRFGLDPPMIRRVARRLVS